MLRRFTLLRWWTLVFCGFMAMSGVRGQQLGEMLPNRSFETLRSKDRPDMWGINTFKTKATYAVDSKVAHSGEKSVRLSGKTKGDRAGVARTVRGKDIDASRVYVLSAWVKIDGTSSAPFRTSARVIGVDGRKVSILKRMFLCDKGPHDWRRYEWRFRIQPTVKYFNLTFFHHGQGTAWWDDVSLRLVEPVEPVAPALDVVVTDGKPAFAWKTDAKPGAILEIAPDGDFGAKGLRTYEVSGDEFTVPEALAMPRNYTWRVSGIGPDGRPFMTLLPPLDEKSDPMLPRFFVGSDAARKDAIRKQFAGYRKTYERLKAFAKRNGMWDDFSLLGNALARIEKLDAMPASGEALARFDKTWDELEFTVPWWREVFLDDQRFFDGLRLDMPGMEKVRAAAEAKNWEKAKAELLEYYRHRKPISYYGQYAEAPPRPEKPGSNPPADQIVAHKYPIYHYKAPVYDFGPDIDWHVYPIKDVSWCSRLHRHSHWRTLSAAYWSTGNDKYVTELVQQLFDWGKDNPMEEWDRHTYRWAWSTLNAGVRLYNSWIAMWMRVHDSPAWTPDAQYIFMTLARENGRYLMRRAARTGNWVLAEARGLAELGIMFPEFKEAETWRTDAFKRLRRELDVQVLPDGVHMERTPGYHGMSLSCFMRPVQLALLNGYQIPDEKRFISALEGMHQFYMYFTKPNLRTPQLGDAGMTAVSGWLMRGFKTFRRLDFEWVATGGKEGKPPVDVSHAFPDAGIYVSRSKWNDPKALYSMIDWGAAGSGHCDDDMGQISLYAYGADLLVDAGRYSYDLDYRIPFNHTSGHNTVMVDGETQKRRDPLAADWVSTDQFDAFQGLTDNTEPLLFQRTLVFRKPGAAGAGYWLVVDRLTPNPEKKSGGKHRIDQRWRATEKSDVSIDGSVATLRPNTPKQPALVIAEAPVAGLHGEVERGPLSYKWYKKIEVDVAQFTVEREGPVVLACALVPTPAGANPARVRVENVPVSVDGKPAATGAATAVRVTIDDGKTQRTDLWVVNHEGKSTVSAGGVETDARIAMVGSAADGARTWMVTHGTKLSGAEGTLFEAAEQLQGAGATTANGTTAVVCTGGKNVRVLGGREATVNGVATKVAARDGVFTLGDIAAPVKGEPPRDDQPMQFEIVPEEAPEVSCRAKMMAPGYALPDGAVVVEAEDLATEGGGRVEVTDSKVAASGGKCFLHWDGEDHWVEWRAQVPRAGRYGIVVRACSTGTAMLRSVSINGKTPDALEAVQFSGTGGFSNNRDDWRAFALTDDQGKPIAIKLGAGPVGIRMENIDGKSMNMDWVALVPAK